MITRRRFAALLAPAATTAAPPAASTQPDLHSLYDAHDWLGLTQAVTPASPLLMRAASAAAMHRYKEAEPLLRQTAKNPDTAVEAHGHLINLYARAGQWRKAFASVQAAQRLRPDRPDFQNAAALFGALARHPDLRARRIRPTRLPCAAPGQLVLPIAVNGQPARYFWDTGANFSLTTESEARRLGLAIESSDAKVNTATGGAVAFRLAIARTLHIGDCLIEHVPFMIFGDDQQPFDKLPQQERGGIGLPVQLALGSLRWDSSGNFDFASPRTTPAPPNSPPNLYFDGLMPCTRLGFHDAELNAQLDTGATTTDLWPPFAKRFSAQLTHAKRETRRVGGVGQNINVESLIAPSLPVRLGGKPLTLKPAEIHLDKTDGASLRDYGRIGMDLLNQSTRITIDFRQMRLILD